MQGTSQAPGSCEYIIMENIYSDQKSNRSVASSFEEILENIFIAF